MQSAAMYEVGVRRYDTECSYNVSSTINVRLWFMVLISSSDKHKGTFRYVLAEIDSVDCFRDLAGAADIIGVGSFVSYRPCVTVSEWSDLDLVSLSTAGKVEPQICVGPWLQFVRYARSSAALGSWQKLNWQNWSTLGRKAVPVGPKYSEYMGTSIVRAQYVPETGH